MTDLSPKARALIRSGRDAYRPRAADRARIDAALSERLGPDAVDAAPHAAAATRHVVTWKIAAGLMLTVCVLGVPTYMVLRPAAKSSPPPPATTTSAPPPEVRSTTIDPTPGEKATPALPTQNHAPPPPRSRNQLSREVALLSRATTALHAGDASAALQALDEHQRKFPNGVLREERRAARAIALCSLGRFNEGRAELERLTPNSPEAARARELCDR